MATATGIFSRGKTRRTTASDAGTRNAAPPACRIREATRRFGFGATPHSAEPMQNITEPLRKTFLRPMRSANLPLGISSAANVIVYALRIHDSAAELTVGKEWRMSG